MPHHTAIVAVFAHNAGAGAAIRRAAETGLDLRHFSIIRKDHRHDANASGFFSADDDLRCWGARGSYWDGLWTSPADGMMLSVPSMGHVMIEGQLAAYVRRELSKCGERVEIHGPIGALGAVFGNIDIPEQGVRQYQRALKANKILVVAYGPAAEMVRAQALLQVTGPELVDAPCRHDRPVFVGARAGHPASISAWATIFA